MASQDSKQKTVKLIDKSRIRVSDLIEAKSRGEKWTMLTSYDAVSARVFDRARIPCLLVGDSAAQMVYGYKSTLPVSLDELIPLARAVSSSCSRALVIADLPFGTYQEGPQAALRSATRFMKESQVHGVKLEGGAELAAHVKLLTQSGIPVVAHIGFTPQSEHALSGFKVQGRSSERVAQLISDACALEEAGAFACVLELMPSEVARQITERLRIPTVGIGAGPHCDAQVLVWHDMAGFSQPAAASSGAASYLQDAPSQAEAAGQCNKLEVLRAPKFVKRYADLTNTLYQAALQFSADVAAGEYPAQEHCYQ